MSNVTAVIANTFFSSTQAVIFERNLQRKFLEVASLCTSVVCSRVTPKQKVRTNTVHIDLCVQILYMLIHVYIYFTC